MIAEPRDYRCSFCHGPHHDRRTCPKRQEEQRQRDAAPRLNASWSEEEQDVNFENLNGAAGADGRFLCDAVAIHKWLHDRSILQELKHRGYDLRTFKLSVSKFPPPPPPPAVMARAGAVNVDADGREVVDA